MRRLGTGAAARATPQAGNGRSGAAAKPDTLRQRAGRSNTGAGSRGERAAAARSYARQGDASVRLVVEAWDAVSAWREVLSEWPAPAKLQPVPADHRPARRTACHDAADGVPAAGLGRPGRSCACARMARIRRGRHRATSPRPMTWRLRAARLLQAAAVNRPGRGLASSRKRDPWRAAASAAAPPMPPPCWSRSIRLWGIDLGHGGRLAGARPWRWAPTCRCSSAVDNAWAEGVGERLTPIELPPAWYLLVDPGRACTDRGTVPSP